MNIEEDFIFYLPSPQSFPLYPGRQLHWQSAIRSSQGAPFLHGPLAHSLISMDKNESYRTPERRLSSGKVKTKASSLIFFFSLMRFLLLHLKLYLIVDIVKINFEPDFTPKQGHILQKMFLTVTNHPHRYHAGTAAMSCWMGLSFQGFKIIMKQCRINFMHMNLLIPQSKSAKPRRQSHVK